MAPFGSSSDSNTIKRGGLLTVLHIFSKNFGHPANPHRRRRCRAGNRGGGRGQRGAERGRRAGCNGLGPLRSLPQRARQQRAGSRGRGSRGPAAEGAAAEGAAAEGRQYGRRYNAVSGTQDRQGQKTARRGRQRNAAGGTGRRAHTHRPSGQKRSTMSGQ